MPKCHQLTLREHIGPCNVDDASGTLHLRNPPRLWNMWNGMTTQLHGYRYSSLLVAESNPNLLISIVIEYPIAEFKKEPSGHTNFCTYQRIESYRKFFSTSVRVSSHIFLLPWNNWVKHQVDHRIRIIIGHLQHWSVFPPAQWTFLEAISDLDEVEVKIHVFLVFG